MGLWLERRIASPSFGAVMLFMLVLFFFAAATNTLSGWLFAMSGLGFAFLLLGLVGPLWELRQIRVVRSTIPAVSVGEEADVTLTVVGLATGLLQIEDCIPNGLTGEMRHAIETLPVTLTYTLRAQQRGIYRWEQVRVRSAAPLGLFWRRVECTAAAELVVYPKVWTLGRSLLLEQVGRTEQRNQPLAQRWQANPSQGATRSVRLYRWGDPMRWVHWRTSARLGQLMVREWENPRGGNELFLWLDTTVNWETQAFETAVETIASLFVQAQRQQLQVALLTPEGSIDQRETVLTYLAGVQPGLEVAPELPVTGTLLWVSPQSPPTNSDDIIWLGVDNSQAAICLVSDQPLGPQLEKASLSRIL
jgi:uncharacterized protein (DUF58 family)